MSGTPTDWNIVIVGAWNLAILTPEGIARRLFELEPETPVEVQVSLDGRAPIRVKYENILVQPSPASLIVTPQEPTPSELEKSVTIAKRALTRLPETPVSAAGLNLRFWFEKIPDSLIKAGLSVIDDKLSDEGFRTLEKGLKRTIEWGDGVINLEIQEREDSSALVIFNYHRNSKAAEQLITWLETFRDMLDKCDKLRALITDGE
jgi:hypothetical protein